MTTKQIMPALSPEALFGKSKLYIGRALASKKRGDVGEYQLWASLALELLGKSTLADIHPCLVADPQSFASLFAAAGMNIGIDVKTIAARTLLPSFGAKSSITSEKLVANSERTLQV